MPPLLVQAEVVKAKAAAKEEERIKLGETPSRRNPFQRSASKSSTTIFQSLKNPTFALPSTRAIAQRPRKTANTNTTTSLFVTLVRRRPQALATAAEAELSNEAPRPRESPRQRSWPRGGQLPVRFTTEPARSAVMATSATTCTTVW